MSPLTGTRPAVEISALGKSFRTGRREALKQALHAVDLTVRSGELVAIVGLNGCGKSTLIRVLATLTFPDTGSVRVFGHDVVRDHAFVRRHINRVSVEASFFKEMTAWENLSYAGRLYGTHGDEVRRRAIRVLSRLGLPRKAVDRPMKQLSRGQQQKVAIARSMLTTPNLLLMDEPTTGLDPRSKREVQGFVEEMHAETGATVLLCTHDLDEAERLCDRVVVMDRGRIVADDTPAALRAQHGRDGTTLEDVFLALTGVSFAEDREEEDILTITEEQREKEPVA
jgi:ABC-2 type transport system ATP-binding protein